MLSLLFGATTYTFSLILAVFLVGLGIGSSLGAAMARDACRTRASRSAGASSGCACAIAWAAYATGASLPFWPINPSISTVADFNFQLDLMRAIWVMLPGAILWGASFPLALAAVAARGQDPAGWSAASTPPTRVGAIVGALRHEPGAGRHGRQSDDAADPDRRRGAVRTADADAGDGRDSGRPLTSTPVVVIGDRARRRPAGARRAAAAVACSSPTAATRRRGWGRTRSSTSAKA